MADQSNMASIKSSTGNAQITQQGHTDNGHFGSDTAASVKYNRSPKNLRISAKG